LLLYAFMLYIGFNHQLGEILIYSKNVDFENHMYILVSRLFIHYVFCYYYLIKLLENNTLPNTDRLHIIEKYFLKFILSGYCTV
jgi:hypothetical protein